MYRHELPSDNLLFEFTIHCRVKQLKKWTLSMCITRYAYFGKHSLGNADQAFLLGRIFNAFSANKAGIRSILSPLFSLADTKLMYRSKKIEWEVCIFLPIYKIQCLTFPFIFLLRFNNEEAVIFTYITYMRT